VVQEGRPLNVYIHPWEIDPEQPRIAAGFRSRFRHYQNLKSTARKLQRLLETFRLTTMSDVLANLRLKPSEGNAPISEFAGTV
jgi:hypothetical protein